MGGWYLLRAKSSSIFLSAMSVDATIGKLEKTVNMLTYDNINLSRTFEMIHKATIILADYIDIQTLNTTLITDTPLRST
jgi:hypothetical protein